MVRLVRLPSSVGIVPLKYLSRRDKRVTRRGEPLASTPSQRSIARSADQLSVALPVRVSRAASSALQSDTSPGLFGRIRYRTVVGAGGWTRLGRYYGRNAHQQGDGQKQRHCLNGLWHIQTSALSAELLTEWCCARLALGRKIPGGHAGATESDGSYRTELPVPGL